MSMKNDNNLFYTCSLISEDEVDPEKIAEVFSSWMADKILDFNSDLYYQPREYLAECYKAGEILVD